LLPASKYGENHQSIAFFQRALERIETLPGVVSAGAVQDLPLRQNSMAYPFSIEGRPDGPAASRPEAAYRAVTSAYFRTMGLPLAAGRVFTASLRAQLHLRFVRFLGFEPSAMIPCIFILPALPSPKALSRLVSKQFGFGKSFRLESATGVIRIPGVSKMVDSKAILRTRRKAT
jgi:hypothetical protein